MGPTIEIAVAPHIDKPEATKILSFISHPNSFPKKKDDMNENTMKYITHFTYTSKIGIKVSKLIVNPNKTIPICNGIVEIFADIA